MKALLILMLCNVVAAGAMYGLGSLWLFVDSHANAYWLPGFIVGCVGVGTSLWFATFALRR